MTSELSSLQLAREKDARLACEDVQKNPWFDRVVCAYGSRCYRKNPEHFRECRHPHLETILFGSNLSIEKLYGTDDVLGFLMRMSHSNKTGVLIGSQAVNVPLTRPQNLRYDVVIESWQLIDILQYYKELNQIKQVICYSAPCQVHRVVFDTTIGFCFNFQLVSSSNEEKESSNRMLVNLCNDDYGYVSRGYQAGPCTAAMFYAPALEVLHAIKASHVGFNAQWLKTIEDLHFFRQQCSRFLLDTEKLRSFTDIRRKEIEIRLFGSSGRGADEKAGLEKKLDCDLFEQSLEASQLNVIRDQINIRAIEQYLVPTNISLDYADALIWQKAYTCALCDICTTNDKFAAFAIEHYLQLKWLTKDLKELYATQFYRNNTPENAISWLQRDLRLFEYFFSQEMAKSEGLESSLMVDFYEKKEEVVVVDEVEEESDEEVNSYCGADFTMRNYFGGDDCSSGSDNDSD